MPKQEKNSTQLISDGLKELGKLALWVIGIAIFTAATYGIGLVLAGIAYGVLRKTPIGKTIFPNFGKIRDDGKAAWRIFTGKKRQEEEISEGDVAIDKVDADEDVNTKDSNGLTLLHKAVQSGNRELIESLLKQGAYVNAQDNNGNTPLHYAMSIFGRDPNFKKVINLLIQWGPNGNIQNKLGEIPEALFKKSGGKPEAFPEFFLPDEYGSAPLPPISDTPAAASDFLQYDILLSAVKIGDIAVLQSGLEGEKEGPGNTEDEKKKLINVLDPAGKTLLHHAVLAGHLKVVEFLCANGADVNIPDKKGVTPLKLADDAIKEYLIANGAKDETKNEVPNVASHSRKRSLKYRIKDALPEAPQFKQSRLIPTSSLSLSDLTVTDLSQQLFDAIETKNENIIIQALVDEFKNREISLDSVKNGNGNSLLHMAIWANNIDAAKLLLKGRANPNIQNQNNSNTPLHMAVEGIINIEMLQLLLEQGADPNIKNINRDTPLFLVRELDLGKDLKDSIIQLLEKDKKPSISLEEKKEIEKKPVSRHFDSSSSQEKDKNTTSKRAETMLFHKNPEATKTATKKSFFRRFMNKPNKPRW